MAEKAQGVMTKFNWSLRLQGAQSSTSISPTDLKLIPPHLKMSSFMTSFHPNVKRTL